MRETKKKAPIEKKKQIAFGLLFKRTFLPGESARLYAEFRQRVFEAIQPENAIEELLACEIIDTQWDILRYRRLLDRHLQNEHLHALERLLETIFPLEIDVTASRRSARKRAIDRTTGDSKSRKEITDQMKRFGLNEESVTAAALAGNIDVVEKITRMTAEADARKNKALREIEFRRSYHDAQMERALEKPKHPRNERPDDSKIVAAEEEKSR